MSSIRNLIRIAKNDPCRDAVALIALMLFVLAMSDLAGVVGEGGPMSAFAGFLIGVALWGGFLAGLHIVFTRTLPPRRRRP